MRRASRNLFLALNPYSVCPLYEMCWLHGIYISDFLGAVSSWTKYLSPAVKWDWFPVKYWYKYKLGTWKESLHLIVVISPLVSRKWPLWKQRASKAGWGSLFLVIFIYGIPVKIVLVGTSPWHWNATSFIHIKTGFAEKLLFLNYFGGQMVTFRASRGLRSLLSKAKGKYSVGNL